MKLNGLTHQQMHDSLSSYRLISKTSTFASNYRDKSPCRHQNTQGPVQHKKHLKSKIQLRNHKSKRPLSSRKTAF